MSVNLNAYHKSMLSKAILVMELQCIAKKLNFWGVFIQNANTRKGRKLLNLG